MTRSRTITGGALSAALVLTALVLLPSAAFGQTTDPGAPATGSPPANQYEIPTQAGRKDGAPPNAQRNSNSGSLYRTDNNFGTSAIVPGDPRGGGGAGGGGGGGGAGGTGGTGGTGGGSGSGSGSGSSGSDGGGLDVGSPSELATYTTLPLIVILGAVIGVAGVRMRRRAEL
jgi:hypothetical protein